MEDPVSIISQIRGVISTAEISQKDREIILNKENLYEKSGVVGLKNPGIRMVLSRQKVISILKDTSFRPPPGPTVFMVEELDNDNIGKNNPDCISFDNRNYFIVGEELIGSASPKNEEFMFIGDDFVLYPDRRKGRSSKPAFFLIPPIGFTELEAQKDELNIKNIISVSPSTQADDYIREEYGFSKRNDYATILVGFDLSE